MSIMAHMWPHVSQKLTTLRKLRMLADQNRAQAAHHEATINYKPEWLWDLLLPSMPEMNNTLGPNPTAEPGNYSTSKMRLRSHFIDRFPDESDSGREHDRLGAAQFSLDSFPIGLDDFEQFRIEELSRGFLETDFWNMVND
ncbi:hypothetical protein N8T08_010307 [Aspergillus melleus]|uniref:Uncharacterized protein n=1 Tax=Aspergillus melleus TaxID=138277 RepID=A0ACC3ARS2_9EURO|nr:hypothetical protein N8T08_010307 [Aspergillus melleus]